MENFGVNLNKVKQPKPDISADGTIRDIKKPYVGIISDINPTSTPILDTLVIKGKETPREKFQIQQLKNGGFNFYNFATAGIIGCSVLALLSLFKRK